MAKQLKLDIRKRTSILEQFKAHEVFLNNLSNILPITGDDDAIQVEVRVSNLNDIRAQFEKIQDSIESVIAENELEDQNNIRIDFENRFYTVISLGKRLLLNFNKTTVNQSTFNNAEPKVSDLITGAIYNNVRLPSVDVPKFDGQLENWLEFRDIFDSVINSNKLLGDVQKFYYLRTSLIGSASHMIQSLDFTGSNYEAAWKTICERYNNNKMLINKHMQSLFELPILNKDSFGELRFLADSAARHLKSLKSLGETTESWDTPMKYLLSTKFDRNAKIEWQKLSQKHNQTFNDMYKFLTTRANLLESISKYNSKDNTREINKIKLPTFNNKKSTSLSIQTNKSKSIKSCNFCKGNHYIYKCQEFLKLPVSVRKSEVSKLKLCLNCLCSGHNVENCIKSNCYVCNDKHNSLLHVDKDLNKTCQFNQVSATTSIRPQQILLATACVKILGNDGYTVNARALLDSGSQTNFISERLCKVLNLPRQKTNLSIIGINNIESGVQYKCDLHIFSNFSNYSEKITCYILPEITSYSPSDNIDISAWNFPKDISLADPRFYISQPVDILLGAGIFWSLLDKNQIQLNEPNITVQCTKLGWIVSGPFSSKYKQITCSLSKCDIQDQLERFWKLEDVPTKRVLTPDEEKCERIFKETTVQNSDGHFIVEIPFRESPEILGTSRNAAMKRFQYLERKFNINPVFKQMYSDFIHEYERLGHMSLIDEKLETGENGFYLPHHGVLNENSTTTKMRVVFDGSAVTSNGMSFNDIQLVGPKIQDDLVSILFRFRTHEIVLCGDIAKMYRQIFIKSDHSIFQKILWRSDPSMAISTYVLNTVTYGTSSAPFLAIRCLQQAAHNFKNEFPTAANIILKDFYVDDLLTGSANKTEVIKLAKEINFILQKSGFNLRKWKSNDSSVESELGSENSSDVIQFGEMTQTKTLGLYWSRQSDTLHFQTTQKMSNSQKFTKRSILSEISSIFDPLGILSPFIIRVKILLRTLWLQKLDWDDEIPDDLKQNWVSYKLELNDLKNIKIPRKIIQNKTIRLELHGFADASKEAYGGCVYIRNICTETVVVHLMSAKTKVSPLKIQTIPRLELCACTILVKLMENIMQSLNIVFHQVYYWTDSSIVLHWLHSNSNQLQIFVGNRVSKIQSLTNIKHWHHISGIDYAGPISIKNKQGKGYKIIKSYIYLFVCFVTKAIHLELVTDLTAESFIAALRRFCSRRGKPAHIYSDNGRNFVKANSELKELSKFLELQESKLANKMSNDGISWHFIPPFAPHMGGLWESGVKSCKHHLKRVLGNALLTYEQMYTVLTQIEAVLNFRPLTPLSPDPNDLDVLTPAHFLIGKRLTTVPDPDVTHISVCRQSLFQRLQNICQHFWKRWHLEYVSELQQRQKWTSNISSVEVGDIIVIKEANLPPLKWQLGRITKIIPGADQIPRVIL